MFNRSLSKTLYLRLIFCVSLLLLFIVGVLCVNKQRAKYNETYAAYESKTLIVRNEDLPKVDISKARKTETVGNITLLEYSSSKKTCESYQQTVKTPDDYSFLSKSDAVVDFPVYAAGETTEGLDSNDNVTDLNEMVENADTVAKPTKTVAVIDTGWIDGPVTKSDKILDEVVLTKDGTKSTNPHGTYIASLIAAWSDPGTRIIPICVATSDEKTYLSDVAKAIVYAVDHGVDYINISMTGVSKNSSEYAEAILGYATAKGIPVITAAGNDAVSTTLAFPACADEAVVVSSVTKEKEVALYSNFGPSVDCASYGSVVVDDTSVSGTSYSAALVTAAYTNGLTYEAAEDICSDGKDLKTGYGLLAPNGYEPIDDSEDSYYQHATILGMDWRSMTDDEITDIVNNTSTYLVKLFIEGLSDSDYDELLARRTSLSAPYSRMVHDVPVEYDSYAEYINSLDESCLVPSGNDIDKMADTGDKVCSVLAGKANTRVTASADGVVKDIDNNVWLSEDTYLKTGVEYKTKPYGVIFMLLSNKWDDDGLVKIKVKDLDGDWHKTHACNIRHTSTYPKYEHRIPFGKSTIEIHKDAPDTYENAIRYAFTLQHKICSTTNSAATDLNVLGTESVLLCYGFNANLSPNEDSVKDAKPGTSYELSSYAARYYNDEKPEVTFYKESDDLNDYGEHNSKIKETSGGYKQLHTSVNWKSNVDLHSWARFKKTNEDSGTLVDFHDGVSHKYTFKQIYDTNEDDLIYKRDGETWYLLCTSDTAHRNKNVQKGSREYKNADGQSIKNIGLSLPITDVIYLQGVCVSEANHAHGYTSTGDNAITNVQTLYTGTTAESTANACIAEGDAKCSICGVARGGSDSKGHVLSGKDCDNKNSTDGKAYAFNDKKYSQHEYVTEDAGKPLELAEDANSETLFDVGQTYMNGSDVYKYMYKLCGRKKAVAKNGSIDKYWCTAAEAAWAQLSVQFKFETVSGSGVSANGAGYSQFFKLYDRNNEEPTDLTETVCGVDQEVEGNDELSGRKETAPVGDKSPDGAKTIEHVVKRDKHKITVRVKPINGYSKNTKIPMSGKNFSIKGNQATSAKVFSTNSDNVLTTSEEWYASGNMYAKAVPHELPAGFEGITPKSRTFGISAATGTNDWFTKDANGCVNPVTIKAPDLPAGLQYDHWSVDDNVYKGFIKYPGASNWKNLTFAMPNEDVTVTLYVRPTAYNVYFHIVDPSKTYKGISTINNVSAPNDTFTAPKPGTSVPEPKEKTVVAPESGAVEFDENDKATFVMHTWLYRYDYIPKPDELWANKPTGWHFIPNANGFSSDYFRNDSGVLSQLDAIKTADDNLFTKQTGKTLNTYQQWNLSTSGDDVHLYCYLEPDRYRIALHESESNAGKSPITNVPACERSTTLAETVVTIPTDLADKGMSLVSNRDPLWDIDVPETNTWYQKHRGYLLQDVSEYKLHSNTWEHYNIKRVVDKDGGVTRAWAVPAVSTRPSSVVTYDNVTQTFGRSKFVGWICNIGTKRTNDSSDYVVDGTGISWGTYTNPDNITCADKAVICAVGDSKFLKTLRDYDSNDLRKPSIGDLQTYNLYPVYDAVPEIYPQVMYKTVDNMSCMFKSPDVNGKRSLLNVNDAWGDTSPNFNWKGVFGYWNIDLNDNTIQPVAINNPTSKPTTKLEYALLYEQANGYSPMIVDRETTNYHYNSGKVGGLKSRDFGAASNSVHNVQDLSDDVTIATGQLKQKFYIDKFAEIPWTASPITTQYMVPWTVVDDIGQSYTFKQYVYVSTKNNLTLQRDNEGFVDITVQ